MLGMSRAKRAPHRMALAVAICRCSPKLSLRSNCTPRYLMLVFHSTLCSSKTILGYWKDLLSVTSKASVFSGAILRPLLSNQCFAPHRLLLTLSTMIPTSSAAHTTSASSAKPMMLVPAVGPSAGNRHTWHSKQMAPPATPKESHMSSLLSDTICRPHISPTCRSRVLPSVGRLSPSSPSRCRCRTSCRSLTPWWHRRTWRVWTPWLRLALFPCAFCTDCFAFCGIPISSGFPTRFPEGTYGCWACRLTPRWSRSHCYVARVVSQHVCCMTLRALTSLSIFSLCSLRSWRSSFHPSAPK